MFSIFWSKQKLFRGKEDLTIINISLFNSFKFIFLPTIFPVHLTPVIIQFSVWATSKSGDAPTPGITMLCSFAMSSIYRNHSLPEFFWCRIIFSQKKLKIIDQNAFNFTYPHVLFFISHADMYTFPSEPQTGPIPDIPLAPDVFTDPLPIMLDKMSDRRN